MKFEKGGYEKAITKDRTIADMFEIVKCIVKEYLGHEQHGLMVGLTDLSHYGKGLVCAFYSLHGNMIIINKRPLKRIMQTNPNLYNNYLFHILLHEYIHSIGSYDELQTRQLVYEISNHYFGQNHVVTQLALNMEKFLPNITLPGYGYEPPQDLEIEFIMGIDRKNTNYIN